MSPQLRLRQRSTAHREVEPKDRAELRRMASIRSNGLVVGADEAGSVGYRSERARAMDVVTSGDVARSPTRTRGVTTHHREIKVL